MPYKPLTEPANALRLITILPASEAGDGAGNVHCRLDTVSLADSSLVASAQRDSDRLLENDKNFSSNSALDILPDFRYVWGDYMALSYTWGDPGSTREVMVNGKTVVITKNLDDCLRALRKKDYIQQGWKIWIDALCINQKDIVERAGEVKRMREIYTKAYTPIIWLGAEASNSEGALTLIERLARDYCSAPDSVNFLTNALHANRELFGAGSWAAMHEFVTRRYWSRMWILQEVAQGRKNTPILCGSSTTSWSLVYPAFSLILNCDEVINEFMQHEVQAAGSEMKFGELWANLGTVKDLQMVQVGRREGRILPHDQLLQLGRMAFSTDPRDKIYGLLGLFDEALASRIVPDYTASIRDVYMDFVKATIMTGSLDVLYHCFDTTREDFPSWLPDWSAPRLIGTPLIFGDNPFATSGHATAEVEYLHDGSLLSCKGILYDRVDGMGHPWYSHSSATVIPSTSNMSPYGSKEKIRQAIWKTMLCDRDVELKPLTTSYECLLAAPAISKANLQQHPGLNTLRKSNIFNWFVQSCQANASFEVCGQPIGEYFTSEEDLDLDKVDVTILREALIRRDRIFAGRKLFTTQKGYFGVGLDRIETDDAVVVLMGATMPVIVRKQPNGYYKFVGESYIHGIMSGEAMDDLRAGLCRIENIILC